MFTIYKNRPLIPTRTAMNELFKYGYDLFDVLEILELGYDCPKSKRAKNIIERCINKKGKIIRVVIADSYNWSMDTKVWAITHFGITKKSKKMR